MREKLNTRYPNPILYNDEAFLGITLKVTFILVLLVVFDCSNVLHSQNNLISNGDFENYSTCPNNTWQIDRVFWNKPPNHAGTPDYFNACSTTPIVGVPMNAYGTVTPYSGDGYVGARVAQTTSPNREYLMDTLTSPLQAGVQYEIGFYWFLAPTSGYATDDLGIYLSTTPSTTVGIWSLGVTPTSHNPAGNYLSNSSSWSLYIDTITAAGGEEFITIGSFNTLPSTVAAGQNNGIQLQAYMYFDSVYVSPLKSISGDTLICFGDSAEIYAIGMSNVTWVDSANPTSVIGTNDTIYVSPNQTTTYLCITSTNDTFSHTVEVIQPLSNFTVDDTVCLNALSQQILNLPGYTIEWSNGLTDSLFQTNSSGVFWAEATINGCTSTDTFTVYNYPFPDYHLADTIICSYDTVEFDPGVTANSNAGTNVSYQWSTGDTSSTILANTSGSYWLEMTYENCTVSDTVLLSYHPEIMVNLGNDLSLCYESSYDLAANTQNAVNYLWSTGDTSFTSTVDSSGVYSLTVFGDHCEAADTIQVTFYNEPYFELPDTIMYCSLDTAEVSTGLDPEGFSFLWNIGLVDSTISVYGGSEGHFWVQVSDSNCSLRDTTYVGMYDPINLELGPDIDACKGDSVHIVPGASNSSEYSFQWNTGSINEVLSVTSTAVYSLTISDGICEEKDDIRVIFFEYPVFDLGNDTVICGPAEFKLDGTNEWLNVDYRWYDGRVEPLHIMWIDADKTIWLRQTNEVCSTTDTMHIRVADPPTVQVSDQVDICNGRPTEFIPKVSEEVYFTWSDGSTDSTYFTNRVGVHYVTVDNGVCQASDTFNLHQTETLEFKIDGPEYVCYGDIAVLNASHPNAYYYQWSTGSTESNIEVIEPGSYSVRIAHPCGITRDTLVIKDCECVVRFPNAFKPTPSGVNQFFGPAYYCELMEYELLIYNRWGEEIFRTYDPDDFWDGTYNGREVSIGAYAYRCVYEGIQGGKLIHEVKTGSVQLLR